MSWKSVGKWLEDNAGQGAALVGSLLTGNVPGAVAAGVSLVSSATGEATPEKALAALQNDQTMVIRLKELAIQEEAMIRQHILEMHKAGLEDEQHKHEQTQTTIRSGDNADSGLIRAVRPLHATLALLAGIAYVFVEDAPDATIIGLLFSLPLTYFGLREVGKGVTAFKKPEVC